MGEIYFFDKTKADFLQYLGFKYIEKIIDDGVPAFVFIQTKELMEKIEENFDPDSYIVGKTVNF